MYRIENKDNTLHIYINGIMEEDVCNSIAKDIRNSASAGVGTIFCHINSYGGSVAGAYSLISTIKSSGLRLITQNEGFAVSAAGILLAAGDEATAFDYSMALIHDPLLGGRTLIETDGQDRSFLEKVKDGLMTILNNRLKLPIDILSKKMEDETTYNANEQLECGLIDEIKYTSNKPVIPNNASNIEAYNIIKDFYNNMEHKDKEEKKDVVAKEVTDTVIEEVTDAKAIEISNLKTEITNLKVENFILKYEMGDKKDLIENAVKAHGVDVLNTLLHFISNVDNKLEVVENKLEVVENKLEVAENKLVEIVNESVEVLNSISSGDKDLEVEAEKYFGLKADNMVRKQLEIDNKEYHDKLFNIYYGL